MTTTVIALGGNALLRRGDPMDPAIQDRNVAEAAAAIIAAVPDGERVVVTHGNGPQVGLLALADAGRPGGIPFPLDVLDAESEGMIGYLLARHLHRIGGRQVATLLTQVVVDVDDEAFSQPTKPIGRTYARDEIQQLADRHGWRIAPEGDPEGASWRRVVASPAPRSVVEVDAVRALLDAGMIVVCAGGGGVPVAVEGDRLVGVEAVVDKDATSALLAEQLGAERLLLLTDVEAVVSGWGTPEAQPIGETTAAELESEVFVAGSMGPKVHAACSFVERTGASAAIGSLDQLALVVDGRAGTRITR
jgi:carbamate kinase